MPTSILRQMTIQSQAREKARRAQRRKEQMADVKKLAKLLTAKGKNVTFTVHDDGYSVTSITAPDAPAAGKPNEWDEVLK